MISKILKRNGQAIDFSQQKITNAIFKAASDVAKKLNDDVDYDEAERLSDLVVEKLNEKYSDVIPSVEQVQDIVVEVLIKNQHVNTSQAYILYRNERQLKRDRHLKINQKIRQLREAHHGDNVQQLMQKYGEMFNAQNNLDLLGMDIEQLILTNNIYIDDLPFLLEECDYLRCLDLNDVKIARTYRNSLLDLFELITSAVNNTSGYVVVKHFQEFINQIYLQMFNELVELKNQWDGSDINILSSYDEMKIAKSPELSVIFDDRKQEIDERINRYLANHPKVVILSENGDKFFDHDMETSISFCLDQQFTMEQAIEILNRYLNIIKPTKAVLVGVVSDAETVKQFYNMILNSGINTELKITNYIDHQYLDKLTNANKISNPTVKKIIYEDYNLLIGE